MNILIDAFGGDNAPLEVIRGGAQAVQELGVTVTLVGDEQKIRDCAEENGLPLDGMEILHAPAVFDIHEEPTSLLKQHADTSMAVGMQALHDGKGDAFVSAGSTGALHVGASLIVRTLKGIKRPALATMVPAKKQAYLLLDCGANVECRPEMLAAFAVMGSCYVNKVEGRTSPSVALANNGAEESKGDTLRRETYQKLKEAGEAGHLNFTGNIEAKEAMLGECDVIVADGYSGNIMLKSIEGTGKLLSIKLKEMLLHSTGTKLAALLLKGQLGDFKKMLDANEVGGTALLGISKPVVKAHGSASEVGICNAVRQAMEVARSGIIDDIAQNIDKMRIEQKAE